MSRIIPPAIPVRQSNNPTALLFLICQRRMMLLIGRTLAMDAAVMDAAAMDGGRWANGA